jgi:hypothetical protein
LNIEMEASVLFLVWPQSDRHSDINLLGV